MITFFSKQISNPQFGVGSRQTLQRSFGNSSLQNRAGLTFEQAVRSRPLAPAIPSRAIKYITDVKPLILPSHKMTHQFEQADMSSPIVTRVVHSTASSFGPKISVLLEETGATVNELNIELDWIHCQELAVEVLSGIEEVRNSGQPYTSIPQELLKKAPSSSIIGRIRDWAPKILKDSDGLILPGGPNLEPEFYNREEPLDIIDDKLNYSRTIVEFSLIEAAKKADVPVIGTCRGTHMFNTYEGGEIEDIVPIHIGWQELTFTDSSRKANLEQLFEDKLPVVAYSHHKQACSKIAPSLEVVMHFNGHEFGNVPKMVMSKEGNQFFGFQFHPEQTVPGSDLKLDSDSKPKPIYSQVTIIYKLFYNAMFERAARRAN